MNFTLTSENIRKAADQCPTARKMLEALAPEAFVDECLQLKPGDIVEQKCYAKCYYIIIGQKQGEAACGIHGDHAIYAMNIHTGELCYYSFSSIMWKKDYNVYKFDPNIPAFSLVRT